MRITVSDICAIFLTLIWKKFLCLGPYMGNSRNRKIRQIIEKSYHNEVLSSIVDVSWSMGNYTITWDQLCIKMIFQRVFFHEKCKSVSKWFFVVNQMFFRKCPEDFIFFEIKNLFPSGFSLQIKCFRIKNVSDTWFFNWVQKVRVYEEKFRSNECKENE